MMTVNEQAIDLARLQLERKGIRMDPIFASDMVGGYLEALAVIDPGSVPGGAHGVAGTSLRDWFAGLAMQSLVIKARSQGPDVIVSQDWASIAPVAYTVADAMLSMRGAHNAHESGNDSATLGGAGESSA